MIYYKYFADMAELADALDLGSSPKGCRFNSCYPHQRKNCAFNSFWKQVSKFHLLLVFSLFATKRKSHQVGSRKMSTFFGKRNKQANGKTFDDRQKLKWSAVCDAVATLIFFVCILIFSLFVFHSSLIRIIFEIRNKKEERKVMEYFCINYSTI